MAWFEDLSPCSYYDKEFAPLLKAIGWLEPEHPYAQGDVEPAVVARLEELRKDCWEPAHCMGLHACGFCNPRERDAASRGDDRGVDNLFIPGGGFLYIAPELILHYIRKHRYRPPDEFQKAVLACPRMNSDDYHVAIFANGPKDWTPKRFRRS